MERIELRILLLQMINLLNEKDTDVECYVNKEKKIHLYQVTKKYYNDYMRKHLIDLEISRLFSLVSLKVLEP